MGMDASPGGWLAALRNLLASLTDIAQVRLDLLGTELEIEKRRLFDGLLLSALALVLLSVGLAALCAFVVLLLGDSHRLAALAGMALALLGAGSSVLLMARRHVRNPQGLFAASVTELQQDRAALQGPDEDA